MEILNSVEDINKQMANALLIAAMTCSAPDEFMQTFDRDFMFLDWTISSSRMISFMLDRYTRKILMFAIWDIEHGNALYATKIADTFDQ